MENLHNNRSTRNFWCVVEGEGIWSAVGQSAEQEADKFTEMQDESSMTAGLMWHSITRKSKRYPLPGSCGVLCSTGLQCRGHGSND